MAFTLLKSYQLLPHQRKVNWIYRHVPHFHGNMYQQKTYHGYHPKCGMVSSSLGDSDTRFDYLTIVYEELIVRGYMEEWNQSVEYILLQLFHEQRRNDDNDSHNVDNSDGIDKMQNNDHTMIRFVVEDSLAKALNWKSWATTKSNIARKYIKPQTPQLSIIQSSFNWLLQTGPLQLFDQLNVVKLGIQSCPKEYLINPEQSYKKVCQVAPSKYGIASTTTPMNINFRQLLINDPTILQYTFNCQLRGGDDDDDNAYGGCQSNCGNCWVSYQTKNQ